MPQPDPTLMLDFDSLWLNGVKSDCEPGEVPLGYAWMTINMLNAGGKLSCRPGYRCIVTFPKGKLQGASLFRPLSGLPQMVACVDGVVYVADYPFVSFRMLPNVQMSPTAKQVYWVQAVQSVKRADTSFSSILEVIDPRNVLFIQDGGTTAPAYYDGTNSGHIRDNDFETPAGSSMAWVGDRLWVAQGNTVFASDIANPFSFREQIYLGGVQGFTFPREVTALATTPSLEFPQLIVYTEQNASIIQANIRTRDLWPQTDNMQVEVFQVGCSSQRSVVSHFGRLHWFSNLGFVYFDAATVGKLTSRVPIRDNEMMVSKSRLNEDLSLVAGAAFGQYVMMSVPAEDYYNKHTWVLNNASIETVKDETSGLSWSGYWLGTRPVEWVYGVIAGAERIYHVSTDEDGENRLWEAFTPDRLDNGCPITWALFSRGYFGSTSAQRKLPGTHQRFFWSDVSLIGIAEDLDLGMYFAGGSRGAFKQIMAKKIKVEKGSLSFDREITAESELFSYKPQARVLRSEDASMKTSQETGSCPTESEDSEFVDVNFQVLLVGHGPATVNWLRTTARDDPDNMDPDGRACQDEVGFNAVRFDGVGAHDDGSPANAQQELAVSAVQRYTSNKTAIVVYGGMSEVGVGFAESIVSQRAADRVAEIVATKMAETEIARSLPPILSIGDESE